MDAVKEIQAKQKTWRHFSQWIEVTKYFKCCDCGLTHTFQFKWKNDKLFWRLRVQHARTRMHRKKRKYKCQ